MPVLLECAADQLPMAFRHLIERPLSHLRDLHQQVNELGAQTKAWHSRERAAVASRRFPAMAADDERNGRLDW